MEILLLIVYAAILALHIWLLVRALRKPEKKRWILLFLVELVSAIGAVGMAFFFDGLRGSGFMPGMSYIMEFFYSLMAGAIYAAMLPVSLLAILLRKVFKR